MAEKDDVKKEDHLDELLARDEEILNTDDLLDFNMPFEEPDAPEASAANEKSISQQLAETATESEPSSEQLINLDGDDPAPIDSLETEKSEEDINDLFSHFDAPEETNSTYDEQEATTIDQPLTQEDDFIPLINPIVSEPEAELKAEIIEEPLDEYDLNSPTLASINEAESAPPLFSPPEAEHDDSSSVDDKAENKPKEKSSIMQKLTGSMVYILGTVLALTAAGATWLASSSINRVNQLEQVTLVAMNESSHERELRLSALEQKIDLLLEKLNGTPALTSLSLTTPKPASSETNPEKENPTKEQSIDTSATPSKAKTEATTEDPNSDKGNWVVNLTSVETIEQAKADLARFKKQKIKAEYIRITVKGKIWYRLRVTGFGTEHEATAYEKYLKNFQDIDVWRQKL
ncbi:MAG: SPOR domain-containing protein [Mariprofundus sp.]|nr:SPOR domain-containing protein [Mariprofundus sp.]